MNQAKRFIIFALLPLIGYTRASFGCPPADLIAPCTCIMNDFRCHETNLTSTQLVELFRRVSKESTELKFYTLSIWRNYQLTELRANTFQDLTFNTIEVSVCPNLVDVHPDAFKGTDATATIVTFSSTGIGRSKNQTIFDVVNKFVNVEELHLYDNHHNDTKIPRGAFTKLKKLKEVHIEGEFFSGIEQGAFNVDNVFVLNIFWTNISRIEDNAFYSEKTMDNNFILNLMDNRLLSGDSFAEKAFSSIAKPTRLYLGHFANDQDYWKTPIKYLPEKTFLPFLAISDKNILVLNGVDNYHLDCTDCRNAWMATHRDALAKISDGFFPLECGNKKKIDDPDNFKNCTLSL